MGERQVVINLWETVLAQLEVAAAAKHTSIEAVIEEALEDYFGAHPTLFKADQQQALSPDVHEEKG